MITQQHWNDDEGNPEGGHTFGTGFAIAWQRGPLGRNPLRAHQNGAFVEEIIEAAVGRLELYQQSKFACTANAEALDHLRAALTWLRNRTRDREARGVEGTHNA